MGTTPIIIDNTPAPDALVGVETGALVVVETGVLVGVEAGALVGVEMWPGQAGSKCGFAGPVHVACKWCMPLGRQLSTIRRRHYCISIYKYV